MSLLHRSKKDHFVDSKKQRDKLKLEQLRQEARLIVLEKQYEAVATRVRGGI